jgi:two-component system cell cycle sensor histidine kinase/response regulator CckA
VDDIQSDAQPEGGLETILVVEDEPTVRQLAVRILRDYGYTVFEAGNGHEAQQVVAMLAGAPVHFAVDRSGHARHERRRNWRHGFRCAIPGASILFMSGYARQLPDGVENPTIAFLQKPFQSSDSADPGAPPARCSGDTSLCLKAFSFAQE